MLQLGSNEPSSSEESNFFTAGGSAVRHLVLSPLADRCYTVHELKSANQVLSLKGFLRSLATVSPLCSTLIPSPLAGAMVADCVYGESLWNRFRVCQPHSIQGASTAVYPLISIPL